jgi:hypothetical protein
MHCILYRTNTYQVPREYAFKTVWRKVTQNELLVYEDRELTKLICRWPLPGNNIKHHSFTSPAFSAKRSEEWMKIRDRLQNRYRTCPDMQYFLDGICRENPRYRSEQLSEIEKFLERNRPVAELLNAVLAECCRTCSYKITQFEYIYKRTAAPETESHTVPDSWKPGLDVQHRSQNVYSRVFEDRTKEAL